MPTPVNGIGALYYSLAIGTPAWVALTSYAATLKVSGGDLQTGEFVSFEDDGFPYIGAGNFEPHEIAVRLLFTAGTTEPYAVLRAAYLAKTPILLRWSYGSGSAPYYRTKDATYLINVPFPEADSGSADPLAVEITLKAGEIEYKAS